MGELPRPGSATLRPSRFISRGRTMRVGARPALAYGYAKAPLQIQVGYELVYDFPQPTPLILALNVHYSRASDMVRPDHMRSDPVVPIFGYRDGFGNWCNRLVAPPGRVVISALGVVNDSGELDPACQEAQQHQLQLLPEEVLVFLLGSR